MVNALSCPVTAKIRLLEDTDDAIEYAKKLESTGISMLTGNAARSTSLFFFVLASFLTDRTTFAAVHGRTARQKKQFVGRANWDVIRRIKSVLSIPVIANGGIGSSQDVQRYAIRAFSSQRSRALGLTGNISSFPRCVEATGVDGVMSSEGLLENPCIFHQGACIQRRQHQSQSALSPH
jgi:tRNA-dihydrouridine synthase 1